MPKPRLLLHIGAPKTGTTSFQSLLFNQQKAFRRHGYNPVFLNTPASQELAELFGCLESNHFTQKHGLHSPYQAALFFWPLLLKIKARLFLASRRKGVALLSSEHLFLRLTSEREINHFVLFLRKYFSNIQVVLYHRTEDSLKKSLYWEYLKSGGRATYDGFNEVSHKPEHNCDWAAHAWSNAVGKDAVTVRTYEGTPDVVDDILKQVLHIHDEALYKAKDPTKKRENTSPSFDKFEQLRQFNIAHPETDRNGTFMAENKAKRHAFIEQLK